MIVLHLIATLIALMIFLTMLVLASTDKRGRPKALPVL